MTTNIFADKDKALEFILEQMFFSEFVPEEGASHHPDGLNFYQWLERKGILPTAEAEKVPLAWDAQFERENEGDYSSPANIELSFIRVAKPGQ